MIELSLEGLVAFALTWALHLSVLLAVAATARRCLARERVAAREAWLKMALLGAPLTAFAQSQWIEVPLGGTLVWELVAEPTREVAASSIANDAHVIAPAPGVLANEAGIARGAEAPPIVLLGPHAEQDADRAKLPIDGREEPFVAPFVASPATASSGVSWWWAVLALWLAGAGLLALRHAMRRARLARRLSRRESIVRGAPREVLDALCADAGKSARVELSSSEALRVPVAFGWLRPEICVPSSLLAELSAEEWKPLIAHELAHLVRRDPLWLALCRAQASLGLGLPPLRWAERTLRADAEWLADAWAASRTSPLALARCLARVADRALHEAAPRGAFALAGHEEPTLTRRVERLLEPDELARSARGGRGARITALSLCASLALVAPALRSAPHEDGEASAATAHPDSSQASDAGAASAEIAPHSSFPAVRAQRELPLLGNELAALERELTSLRERVSGTSLEAECAPLFERWEARLLELRAELTIASLPQSVASSSSSR